MPAARLLPDLQERAHKVGDAIHDKYDELKVGGRAGGWVGVPSLPAAPARGQCQPLCAHRRLSPSHSCAPPLPAPPLPALPCVCIGQLGMVQGDVREEVVGKGKAKKDSA